MRKQLVLGFILVAVSSPVLADHAYQDRARVIAVTPQIQRVNSPVQECRTEYVREQVYQAPSRSNTGAIVGGVAGGLLGSTIGRGNGRVVAAAIGAGVGAIVGDRVDNQRVYPVASRVEHRPVERCVTVDQWSDVVTGYLVDYEYNGRRYSTVTDQDPGRFINVQVSVQPGGYVREVRYDDDDWKPRRHHGKHKYHY